MPPSSCPTDLGWHGKVAVFHLCWHISGLLASQVSVPPSVSAVLGKNLTLECRVDVATNLTLTQSSWERRLPTGSVTVAVYNPRYGISISPEFIHRLYFRSPSSHDATIVLENVGFADTGVYTCKVATFPLGNTQASTTVGVLVEPKVYVSAGSTALIDGSNETAVATCIAERARPPAEVSWESELFGQSEVQLFDDVNGTATTQVRYLWRPTRHVRGRSLTCVVRHPALLNDFRVPYQLNVQFAPDIAVAGYDGNWYVGRDDVRMTCKANANPPAHHFRWIRLDGEMPEGVEILNSTLLFLRPLQKNDSGVYRCEVANDIDLRSRDLRVLVQDPPISPSTITAPVLSASFSSSSSSSSSSTLVDDKLRVHLGSPTLQALPESNLGTVVGGAVGGALFLLLLLCLAGVWYLRKRQTFHGDRYAKRYPGPSDLRKAPGERHRLHAADASAAGSRRRQDHDREEWGGRELERRRGDDGDECPSNGYTRAMREGGHREERQTPPQGRTDDRSPRRQPGRPRYAHAPKATSNGAPYVPNDRYDSAPEGDYVSHKDGSVISRREWYV
ncbi:nectin-3-like protein isoform X1 [Phycodurus eques]|uniref:nectin-3-like protein isoform X1 n=1 Tax=Phycodurus eques TaxID=693459 RepID=UPI002ACD6AB3|nr:nectin-3-like protein isoform X1 [Phycodurus eques]